MFDRIRPPDADEGGTREPATADRPVAVSGEAIPPPDPPGPRTTCSQCGARVAELRRGRCWGCYQAWAGVRPVGQGARCVVCAERRRDSLRLAEIHGRWLPMCHGCATRATRLSPVPYTLDGLRRALSRERRHDDRRIDALDVRVFPRDRRQTERRHEARDASEDPGDLWVELDPPDADGPDVTSAIDLHPAGEDKTDPRIAAPAPDEVVIGAEASPDFDVLVEESTPGDQDERVAGIATAGGDLESPVARGPNLAALTAAEVGPPVAAVAAAETTARV